MGATRRRVTSFTARQSGPVPTTLLPAARPLAAAPQKGSRTMKLRSLFGLIVARLAAAARFRGPLASSDPACRGVAFLPRMVSR